MSFTPNKPQSTDDPTDSQVILLNNFGKMNADFQINHSALTSASKQGFHSQINFPKSIAADPDLAATVSSLYPKDINAISELFFQNGATSADVKQLTGLVNNAVGTNFTFITPFGFTIQCGRATGGTATFAVPFDPAPVIYTSLATAEDGTNIKVTATSDTTMTYTSVGGSIIFYLVIGI